MFRENEAVMLLIGLGVLMFILTNYSRLKVLPASKVLVSAFLALLMGWILTITENFFLGDISNCLEHFCYAVSSILVAVWCWRVFGRRKEVS